jgi:hypothetical protein
LFKFCVVAPLDQTKEYGATPFTLTVTPPLLWLQLDGNAVAVTTGNELTVTTTDAPAEQPAALVPVTLYVVFTVGDASTVPPVVADNPAVGTHVYVVAPFAVRETEPPAQMAGADAVMETVGVAFTSTKAVALAVHPFASVPITVYVVGFVGLAVTDAPVVVLRPVFGVHVYVAAPLAVKMPDAPAQIVRSFTSTTGTAVPPTVALPTAWQPMASFTVKLYVLAATPLMFCVVAPLLHINV